MKILGLDLGVASIGWALIEVDNETYEPINIIDLGSRIVNLSTDETKAFTQVQGITPNAQRTINRTARKMLSRSKQRKRHLKNYLHSLGMYDRDNTLDSLPPLKLWELRAKASNPEVRLSLAEIGRVLIHICSKRGYRHSRQGGDSEAKDTNYVSTINHNYAQLKEEGLTLGQKMYAKLKESQVINPKTGGSVVTYRIKEGDSATTNLLPRQAHEDELRQILNAQQKHYPELLTEDVKNTIHNIIFYQRPLKSCKNLVGRDEMFDFRFRNGKGKEVDANPRVAPRTSPIFQLTRIWETVNNIRLINRSNMFRYDSDRDYISQSKQFRKTLDRYVLDEEERKIVVDYLNTHDKLTTTDLLRLLGLKRKDGFKLEMNIAKGIKGNETYMALYKALEGLPDRDEFLRFEPVISEHVDETTGEVRMIVDSSVVNEPLYRLWHAVYSISDEEALRATLQKQFNIQDSGILDAIAKIDFTTPGFSNRSVKFMRRILPYLMEGDVYSDACLKAGFRHSDYMTKQENADRELKSSLSLLKKGELRQPLIEKVLNQMINIVNSLLETYGEIHEVRIELARSLKQSKDQRVKAENDISANEKLNQKNGEKIKELGVPVNRRTLQKYRMWEETQHRCIYCGQTINLTAFLSGELSDVEHIIPRSLFFDDSFSNKTCSCSRCNREKGQMTAYDYMQSKGEQALLEFQHRVEDLHDKKVISQTKLRRFFTPAKDIPQDFIERDLQQTRYISRKAMEILREVVRSVYASSGKVTDFFRNAWGYNRLLEGLNIEKYEKAGQVEKKGSRLMIKDWTKRLDHRHHTVDALTVALTRQGYIQRLNTLSASRDQLRTEVGDKYTHEMSLLEQWASSRPHFSPSIVMKRLSEVSVSFKSGKKTVTPGYITKNSIRQGVPRGPLHEETVYGCIYVPDGAQDLIKCLKNPDIISDSKIREYVVNLLNENNGNISAVKKKLTQSPLTTPGGKLINKVATRRREYVKRESVASLKAKQIDRIVDKAVREAVKRRFEECGSEKAFQQSFAESPLSLSSDSAFPIKRVTRTTGLKDSSMVTVKSADQRAIGFSKTGSNHHIAFYENPDGTIDESVVSFWMAVKRRNLGLPALIAEPDKAWTYVEQLNDSKDVEEVAQSLPSFDSKLVLSLAANEMVVLGLSDEEWEDAVMAGDFATVNRCLYRVQKLASKDYVFRHHTHTLTTEDDLAKETENYVRLKSWKALQTLSIRKVRVDILGNIVDLRND